MSIFVKTATEGKIGLLCKRGAWLIAGLGIVQIVMQTYALWQMYHQIQVDTPLGAYNSYATLLYSSSSVFTSAIQVIFYGLVLYTAGVIIDMVFKTQSEESDEVTIESLEDEDVVTID